MMNNEKKEVVRKVNYLYIFSLLNTIALFINSTCLIILVVTNIKNLDKN